MTKERPSVSELDKALKASQRETFEQRRHRARVYRASVMILMGIILVAAVTLVVYSFM